MVHLGAFLQACRLLPSLPPLSSSSDAPPPPSLFEPLDCTHNVLHDIHTHTRTHAYTHTHAHTHACTHTRTHTHMHAHTHNPPSAQFITSLFFSLLPLFFHLVLTNLFHLTLQKSHDNHMTPQPHNAHKHLRLDLLQRSISIVIIIQSARHL